MDAKLILRHGARAAKGNYMKMRCWNIWKATKLMCNTGQRRTCLVALSAVCLFLSAWPARAQGIVTTFAGNGNMTFSGDGVPATAAAFNHPRGLAIDSAGGVYISDTDNWRVRRVTPAGIVSTVAGNGT
jgi:hypothetical protein